MGLRSLSYLQNVALFIVFLVVSIPFYTANVHAASSVTQVTVTGQDALESGVVRQQDYRTVTAKVKIDDDMDVTADQVTLGFGVNQFDNCVNLDNVYWGCTYEDKVIQVMGGDSESVTVVAHDDEEGDVVATGTKTYYPDKMAPTVSFFMSEDVENSELTFTYSVTDKATPATTLCAGISGITIYAGDNPVHFIDGNGLCNQGDQVTLPSQSFATGNQYVDICMDAKDIFDQQGEKVCHDDFEYDSGAPELIAQTLTIEVDGEPVGYVGAGKEKEVDISIEIMDDSLQAIVKNDVEADMSNVVSGGYSSQKPTMCTFVDGFTTCTWKGVPLVIGSEEEGASLDTTVTFTAEDKKGHEGTLTVDLAQYLSIDSKGPVVTEIISQYQNAEGQYFLGGGFNQVIAFISESESGVTPETIAATGGVPNAQPTECIEGAGCYWNFTESLGADGSKVMFNIDAWSHDLADNAVSGVLSQEFFVDKSAPQLLAMNFSNEVGAHCDWDPDETEYCDNESLFRSDDTMVLQAVVEESISTPYVFLNASGIAIVDDLVPGGCEERWEEDSDSFDEDGGTGIWDCYFEPVGPLYATGNAGFAEITVIDDAGNNVTELIEIKVYKKSTQAFFVGAEITDVAPDKFSRETTPYSEQSSFIRVRLQPTAGAFNAEARSFELLGCEDNEDMGFFLDSSEFMTEGDDGLTKWFTVNYNRIPVDEVDGDDSIDDLEMSCYFAVVGQSGSKLTDPQTINATYEVDFYGLPMGTLDSSLEDEVEDSRKKANRAWDLLLGMKRFLNIVNAICTIWFTLMTVVQVLKGIVGLLNCLSNIPTLQGTCGTAQATDEGANTLEKVEKVLNQKWARWICAAAQCQLHREVLKQIPALDNLNQVFNNMIKNSIAAGGGNPGHGQDPSQQGLQGGSPTATTTTAINTFDYNAAKSAKKAGELEGMSKAEIGREFSGQEVHEHNWGLPNVELFNQGFIRSHWGVSLAFVCLPGIIDHLIRMRELECRFIQCMENDVAVNGVPAEFCRMVYDHEKCIMNNEIWTNLIPFSSMMNLLGQFVGQFHMMVAGGEGSGAAVVMFVWNLGMFVASIACSYGCKSCTCGSGCGICTLLGLYESVTSVVSTIQGLAENPKGFFWYEPNYCSEEVLSGESEDDSDDDEPTIDDEEPNNVEEDL